MSDKILAHSYFKNVVDCCEKRRIIKLNLLTKNLTQRNNFNTFEDFVYKANICGVCNNTLLKREISKSYNL